MFAIYMELKNRYRHLKLKDIVVYENNLKELDIAHCMTKVKVMVTLKFFFI